MSSKATLIVRFTFLEHIAFMFRFSPIFEIVIYLAGAYIYELYFHNQYDDLLWAWKKSLWELNIFPLTLEY